MANQQEVATRQQSNSEDGTSRRRFLKAGAALAGAALATTVIDQRQSKAALQLGDVQGESSGSDAGVAGINFADGDGVLGVGTDGPAIRAHNCDNGVAIRAETVDTVAIDAYSETGQAIHALADDNIAVRAISPLRTAILGSSDKEPGVRGVSIEGSGVRGESSKSSGVSGDSTGGPGVRGHSVEDIGVLGISDEDAGVLGSSGAASGVRGFSGEGIGVEGLSPYGIGVEGFSASKIGVRGHTANAVGVQAEATGENGSALVVKGRARFESAGNVIMPAGSDNLLVYEPLTTAESHVSATFMAHPAPKAPGRPMIFYIDREPGYGFWIYLTEPVAVDRPISYLVVDPTRDDGPTRDPNSHG